MASRIGQLPAGNAPLSSLDYLWVEQSSLPKRISWAQFLASIGASATVFSAEQTFSGGAAIGLGQDLVFFNPAQTRYGSLQRTDDLLSIFSEDGLQLSAATTTAIRTRDNNNIYFNVLTAGGNLDDAVYLYGGDKSPVLRTRTLPNGGLESFSPETLSWSRVVNAGSTSSYANPTGTLAAKAQGKVFTGTVTRGFWYTIAKNPAGIGPSSNGTALNNGSTASGRFTLVDTTNNNYQTCVFYAQAHFGQPTSLTVLANDVYSGPAFTKLRILQPAGIYGGCFLQVYVDGDGGNGGLLNPRVFLFDDVQQGQWTLTNFEPMNTVPTGYTAHEFNISGIHAGFFNTTTDGREGVTFTANQGMRFGSVGSLTNIGSKTYGGIAVKGYKNGFAGFAFPDATATPTFMVQNNGIHGVYQQDLSNWVWYHDHPNSIFKILPQLRVVAGAVYDDGGGIGGAWPASTQDTTYSFVLADRGKVVRHTSASAHTWTIPLNSSVAFPAGTIIKGVNFSGGGTVTISPTGGVTLRQAGTTNTGNRSVAANGVFELVKVDTDTWYISGSGVT